ncbi:RRP12-like protein isoform X4 [Branchiostoma floridae]|uniref:RRP12-like protein isoform X1 n=1 Tax=Branchiostoma floridae TaxID=7739 RepID=A0A9J7KZZ4_BRAFL|nr:RRP12-like protein isoform X1 [Branchiostoma floridae]XP_035673333.1 RRP12-like protein isoform X2 [Branchiostoma floridae]XP_035673334.1 RRP12-like protein isoform X3 [Branchiostoma floridae]XP_035673335.1 RRP12-like protein isoform X4 [Branchiostoma floridae]
MTKIKRLKAGKGKRWRKGQSSSSNPDVKSHRAAARNRFFNYDNQGKGDLTESALRRHDQAVEDGEGDVAMGEGDVQSVGGGTLASFRTGFSAWSDCTNTTFNKVERYWQSNSAQAQEVCAVLAAVTEVIKSQGGKETETEYFAALMTALETVEGDESLSAVTYLLALVMKKVPSAVLQSRFSDISKSLMNILAANINTTTHSILRWTVVCLGVVLRQQEAVVWSDASTLQLYHGLLNFTSSDRPRVRKAAQHAVCSILRGSPFMTRENAPAHHPAASATAKFCIQQMEECGGGGEAKQTMYILGLQENILPIMPLATIKSICETILKVMTLGNVLVTSVSMKTLHAFFRARPKHLSPELNAQIISALFDYQPGLNDAQPTQAWLTLMQEAHVNLAGVNAQLCLSHLPRMFHASMECLLSEKPAVVSSAADTMKNLLKSCVEPTADRIALTVSNAPSASQTPVHKIFGCVEAGLQYRYHAAWGKVIQVLAVFFEVLGKRCHSLMQKCLASLADLRSSHKFPHTQEVDRAVGAALRAMGPRVVLQAVPLQIKGDESDDINFPRSWLLPVIRDHVRDTELGYFVKYFLPLAAQLRTRALELQQEGKSVLSKAYDTLQHQIWSALPGFCTRPTDLAQSFKGIARILGSAITDRPDLRNMVLLALRTLLSKSTDSEENKKELGRFAKNYLPILFNIYTTEPKEGDPTVLPVLATVKSYLTVAPSQLVHELHDKATQKMEAPDTTVYAKNGVRSLMAALVPYVDQTRLANTYQITAPLLQSKDITVQKRAYRLLEELVSCTSESCQEFVESHLEQLQTQLLGTLSASKSPARAPRLKCLIHVVKRLPSDREDFLKAILPEVILCTKEVAVRARLTAFTLLVEMGQAWLRGRSSQDRKDAIEEFLQLVFAGLGGSNHMMSATVLALTRLMYEFKDLISASLLGQLVESICLVLSSKAKDVVKSALGFVKVLVMTTDNITLAQHVRPLVECLVSWGEDYQRKYRFKTKKIFEKLVKKFGYEMIAGMVPDSHQKVLVNIRKTLARCKKKKQLKEAGEHEEDSDEEELMPKKTPQSIDDLLEELDSDLEEELLRRLPLERGVRRVGVAKAGQPGLRKGTRRNLWTFWTHGASKRIIATNPGAKGGKGRGDPGTGFKMAADGRMIITEEEEDEEEQGKKKQKRKSAGDDDDEMEDLMEDVPGLKSGKRKHGDLEDSDEEDQSPRKYKAGGKGIHRPLNKAGGSLGEEYKAKKAGGDIKKKGQPDPYAYVQLNPQYLNKRKRQKRQGQFKGMVRAAQRGAEKGGRAQNTMRRKMKTNKKHKK